MKEKYRIRQVGPMFNVEEKFGENWFALSIGFPSYRQAFEYVRDVLANRKEGEEEVTLFDKDCALIGYDKI